MGGGVVELIPKQLLYLFLWFTQLFHMIPGHILQIMKCGNGLTLTELTPHMFFHLEKLV